MSLKLQIIIIICLICVLIYISRRVSQNKLGYKFGIFWVLVCVVLVCFTIWPKTLSFVAHLLGIYDPVNMLAFLGLIIAVVLIFSLSIEVSKQSEEIKRLAQELSILRKDTFSSNSNNSEETDK